jgi:hypothetical protein
MWLSLYIANLMPMLMSSLRLRKRAKNFVVKLTGFLECLSTLILC